MQYQNIYAGQNGKQKLVLPSLDHHLPLDYTKQERRKIDENNSIYRIPEGQVVEVFHGFFPLSS